MAQKTITIYEDDLTGGEAVETVKFSLDGVDYEIDLNAENAGDLRKAFDPYTSKARRAGRPRSNGSGRAPARTDKAQLDAMRRWARENGYQVSDRGRVSAKIQDAYNAAR